MSESNFEEVGYSGNCGALFDAIGKATQEFTTLHKATVGQIGNQKFQYANFEDVRESILPALGRHGVSFIQPMHTVGNRACVTLVVFGHNATISSRFLFDINPKPQEFGKESTYYRRYQLKSFFCVEGDKDLDDGDSVVAIKKVAPKETAPVQVVKVESKAENKAYDKVGLSEQPVSTPAQTTKQPVDVKSLNDTLMAAVKSLSWGMSDVDCYIKSNIEEFPGYVSPAKLAAGQKQHLLDMMVKNLGVTPF